MNKPLKQPVSVLVVLHDGQNRILLIERAANPGFWQSVTGSIEMGEMPQQTALREVWEETGIRLSEQVLNDWQQTNVYEIYHHWLHRYPEGITHNTEHVFSACIPADTPVCLNPDEHAAYQWLPAEAAAEKVFSPSNRQAILDLHKHR